MKLPQKNIGFTLFELLIVMAIIAILFFSFVHSYNSSRQTQALRVSAEEVADKVREAHIFSREQKDDLAWGVRRSGDNTYELLKGSQSNYESSSNGVLENGVVFENEFEIWFDLGTGETGVSYTINLVDKNGRKVVIEVLPSGVVEVGTL